MKISTAERNIMPSRREAGEDAISARRWRRCHHGATMKKMPSRGLIFRTFRSHVNFSRIDRFQRFSYQIKVEDKRFNLIWESLKSVDFVQSYMPFKSVKNETPRNGIFFIVALRWHLLQCRAEMAWYSPQPWISKLNSLGMMVLRKRGGVTAHKPRQEGSL